MSRIRRILHPSDFSRASAAAFSKAVEMAKGNRAELWLVHVLSPVIPMTGEGYMSPKVYEQIEASARAQAKRELERRAAKAKRAGVRTRTLLMSGQTHEQINRAVRRTRADLVVIGTHGRTGLAKLFLGSVAGRVVSTAPCPVLTVRGK